MAKHIELGIEKMNHGHWLRVNIPYITKMSMTATLQNKTGGLLKTVNLVSGNNLIDLESMANQAFFRVKIDTPFETVLKEMDLK